MNPKGDFEELTPNDLRKIKAYIDTNRTLTTPFDIVAEGSTDGLDQHRTKDKLQEWVDADATWWIEDIWEASEKQAAARLRHGRSNIV
jgi:hypothetical protein